MSTRVHSFAPSAFWIWFTTRAAIRCAREPGTHLLQRYTPFMPDDVYPGLEYCVSRSARLATTVDDT